MVENKKNDELDSHLIYGHCPYCGKEIDYYDGDSYSEEFEYFFHCHSCGRSGSLRAKMVYINYIDEDGNNIGESKAGEIMNLVKKLNKWVDETDGIHLLIIATIVGLSAGFLVVSLWWYFLYNSTFLVSMVIPFIFANAITCYLTIRESRKSTKVLLGKIEALEMKL